MNKFIAPIEKKDEIKLISLNENILVHFCAIYRVWAIFK